MTPEEEVVVSSDEDLDAVWRAEAQVGVRSSIISALGSYGERAVAEEVAGAASLTSSGELVWWRDAATPQFQAFQRRPHTLRAGPACPGSAAVSANTGVSNRCHPLSGTRKT